MSKVSSFLVEMSKVSSGDSAGLFNIVEVLIAYSESECRSCGSPINMTLYLWVSD